MLYILCSFILMPQSDILPFRARTSHTFTMNSLFFALGCLAAIGTSGLAQNVSNDVDDMNFYLWTRENPDLEQELLYLDVDSVLQSNFDSSRPTKILAHGWTHYGLSDYIIDLKDSFLQAGDFNVISVDYELLANPAPYYINASENALPVGYRAADFISFLVYTAGGTIADYHPIGFSLGAQVVGLLGQRLNGQLPRITGLDPAGTMFHTKPATGKLSTLSAQLVDVIHTAGLWIGTDEPCGHINFYPNGGLAPQDGCEGEPISLTCSHHRAPAYYSESITSSVGFVGLKCDSLAQYENGECVGNEENLMGYPVDGSKQGIFFLSTNPASPYAMG